MTSRRQRTICSSAMLSGRGLHSGQSANLTLLPAAAGSGIRFRRIDMPGKPEIVASLDTFSPDELLRRTTLAANGAKVETVEHLLAAAHVLGVDNLIVELDAAEPPFADGSAKPYVDMMLGAGVDEQDGAAIEPIAVPRTLAFHCDEAGAGIVAVPSHEFRVTFFFSSENPLLRRQTASVVITPESFLAEIAPARTFCFFDEVEQLLRGGLIRGGSLANAIVIGRKAILNESLRYADEPVRHKILDFIGDLALLGRPLLGHFLAWRSGHRANAAFGVFLRKELGF